MDFLRRQVRPGGWRRWGCRCDMPRCGPNLSAAQKSLHLCGCGRWRRQWRGFWCGFASALCRAKSNHRGRRRRNGREWRGGGSRRCGGRRRSINRDLWGFGCHFNGFGLGGSCRGCSCRGRWRHGNLGAKRRFCVWRGRGRWHNLGRFCGRGRRWRGVCANNCGRPCGIKCGRCGV